ncbi:MAG: undecaprenyldiphospho-muramoylpentapeptide beta-N-acetylglucosaminyltransferase [Candidatus Fimenecus sp.]
MKVLFAAGGTGGHINPALAVAGEILSRNPGTRILFVGTKNHMESTLVPKAGFEIKTIDISGFVRSLSLKAIFKNIETVFKYFKASFQTRKIICEFSPDIVIGFGGYVSGPVVKTAYRMKIPTVIHEQNAYPGIANKQLAKCVDAVCLTVKDALNNMTVKNKLYITGLPVRKEILNAKRNVCREKLGLCEDDILILSFGGSLGADMINKAMLEIISKRANRDKFKFIHGYGKYGKWFPDKLKEKGVNLNNKNIDVREYINDMDICLPAADLVISRAGASTLSELECVGVASILIPSPNVSENHQYHNAMTLKNVCAAEVIEEKELTNEKILEVFDELTKSKQKLKKFGENAHCIFAEDANIKICEIIENLIKE